MKQILFNIFLWVWCFPQQLLGFILSRKKGAKQRVYSYYKNLSRVCNIYLISTIKGSVSLGNYILLESTTFDKLGTFDRTIQHETGHFYQSLIFGWLYLLVIGLPSFIWCRCFKNYRQKHNKDYYSFWTEKWADKLGGVKR